MEDIRHKARSAIARIQFNPLNVSRSSLIMCYSIMCFSTEVIGSCCIFLVCIMILLIYFWELYCFALFMAEGLTVLLQKSKVCCLVPVSCW